MRAIAPLSVALIVAGCSAAPPPAAGDPSVLVDTVRPTQGSLPTTITAYGSVAPSLAGTQTLSMAQPGQVTQLLVVAGAAVRAGQSLGTFVTAPTARSAFQQAANALTAARKQRASTAQLLSQQLATQDQLVQADKAVTDAQTTLAALGAEGAGQAVRTLTAPFDGVVTAIAVAQGDRTQAGSAILTVARTSGIVVTAGIDPSQRAQLAAGQPARLTRLSGGAPLAGHVVRVGSALNARTRLVDVDLSFPAGALLSGEGMQVAIETGRTSGWVVPHRAVVTAGGPAHVFQIVNGKAQPVPVQVTLQSDAGDVVQGAIDGRRPVIVGGAYQVNDGDAVRWHN